VTEKLYFEDVSVGDTFVGVSVAVDRDQMLWFAQEFDDQAMHLEAEAAQAMGLKDIIAPGAHIFALSSRSQREIWKRLHMLPSGLGIEISFLRPIYAGDTITAHVDAAAVRPSSKPGRGWVETKTRYLNQHDEIVAEGGGSWLLTGRPGGGAAA